MVWWKKEKVEKRITKLEVQIANNRLISRKNK